jgi:hypothetical protein
MNLTKLFDLPNSGTISAIYKGPFLTIPPQPVDEEWSKLA